ncbi:hypothetical protein CF67_07001 [Candidatus Photodesmus blepharus]|uniref:Lipid/polyisoprenoid-binding YceI-like domain-containing protein n=1 Tax=Candidatus Photodesmus blepharonis TaxID=1179155 RepID=A0A084CMA3_9GAMM|nr:YceI family protein [Candidatus Photodesmus blepharus]KEY90932.1 hypothetical protein CF67_07001 [Candidatus Photodesmus blepharus]
MIKYIFMMLFSLLSFFSTALASYTLNNSSIVSYVSIKKQYVLETATINTLSGSIKNDGLLDIAILPIGLNSLNPIRDKRLNELFFQSDKYPSIRVSGNVDLSKITDIPVRLTTSLDLTLLGNTRKIQVPVLVVKSGEYLSISSTQPIIINARDFLIPIENLKKLADTVGGISISDTVPVSVSLIFTETL